jgi:hypothetical protein
MNIVVAYSADGLSSLSGAVGPDQQSSNATQTIELTAPNITAFVTGITVGPNVGIVTDANSYPASITSVSSLSYVVSTWVGECESGLVNRTINFSLSSYALTSTGLSGAIPGRVVVDTPIQTLTSTITTVNLPFGVYSCHKEQTRLYELEYI